MRSEAGSFIARSCRMRVEPVLVFVISSMGGCQVRWAVSGSVAVKYVRAIWRFNTGWRNDSFLAFKSVRASLSSFVRKLCCLRVTVSSE